MNYQAVLLPIWSPNWRIILAKYQLGDSYTFWTMSILIFSPAQIIMGHPICLKHLSSWYQIKSHGYICYNQYGWHQNNVVTIGALQVLNSDRLGVRVTMHPAQPDQWRNREFVKILKVSSKLPKIMLILKN